MEQPVPETTPPRSARTTVRRLPDRGAYAPQVIEAILDEGLVCHVGFVVDGQPYVIPTAYARQGRRLLLHGAASSRMLRMLGQGVPVCVTVTLLDGLVFARSAYNHSMNYRSVVVLGTATEVDGVDEKTEALRAIVEHVCPGRWVDVRPPSSKELLATRVFALSLDEASAKIRTGPPIDEPEDDTWPCWAGVLPLAQCPLEPIADPGLAADRTCPGNLRAYRRPVPVEDSEA